MTEIEKLILAVESQGAANVNKELDSMDRKVKTVESSWKGLKTTVLSFVAAGTAIAGAALFVTKKLIDATKSYQDYHAQLEVATKSSENASRAYDALVRFATETPYSVKQGTDAFIQLVNLGLNPSERALRSYGNTASAMNRELIDFVNAVGHASTGQFEALRSFGIQAINMGAKVAFSFQGSTKMVNNNAKSIEAYLMSIGENQFAGAMEKRMQTLTGVISNLEDAWDQMWTAIAQQGPDALITQAFKLAGDAVTEVTNQIKSGQLQYELKAVWQQIKDIGDIAKDFGSMFGDALTFVATMLGLTDATAKDVLSLKFPMYAKYTFGILSTEAKRWMEDGAHSFTYIADIASNEFNRIVELAKVESINIAKAIQSSFSTTFNVVKTGFTQGPTAAIGAAATGIVDTTLALGKLGDETEKVNKKFDDQATQLQKNYEADKAATGKWADEIVGNYEAGLNKENALFDNTMALRDKARADYDAKQNAPKQGDQLAQYQVQVTSTINPLDQKALDDLKRKQFTENIKDLETSMAGENEVVSRGYSMRRDEILSSVTKTEDEKKEAILQALQGSIVSEHDALVQQYEARRQFILSSTQLTEDQKQAMLTKLAQNQAQALLKLDLQTQKQRLDAASTFFGNIASIGSTFGKKGFEIAKAASIAQATIKTYEAATAAYASLSGIPYVGPALGAAAAAAAVVAGAANIAQIKAQQYTPAYAMGGMIPAGKVGLVGEAGPEIVKGPAVVTSAATTAQKRGGSDMTSVAIHNYGAPADASVSKDSNGNLMVILTPLLDRNKRETKAELAKELVKGGTPFTKNLETHYQVQRNGR